jgi:hypothetical protein
VGLPEDESVNCTFSGVYPDVGVAEKSVVIPAATDMRTARPITIPMNKKFNLTIFTGFL